MTKGRHRHDFCQRQDRQRHGLPGYFNDTKAHDRCARIYSHNDFFCAQRMLLFSCEL